MKVAIWAKSSSPAQADFYAALRRQGIDLIVLYLENLRESRQALGWEQPAELPQGEVLLAPTDDPFRLIGDWRERVHVIQGYSRSTFRRAAIALSAAQIPWVHWSESSRPVWRGYISWFLKRWYAGLVNRSALGAFGHGHLASQDFRRWGVRTEKIAHLFYAIRGVARDTNPDAITQRFVAGRTAFVFVGSLCRRKACDVLLQAFAQESPYAETALVLVGDGPQAAHYRRQVDALGLHDRVLFRGVMPIQLVGSVLAACHVLVLPSRFDGWGVVINEAASAGLALIATDRVGAGYHLIEPGLNGFIVRAGNVPSLAAAMRAYANDTRIAAVHGAHSRLILQRFTPEQNAERFVTAMRGWLAAGLSGPRFIRNGWLARPVNADCLRLLENDGANVRVLVVTPYYLPGYKAGGPIRSLANLVDQLSDQFDFHVIAGDRDLGDGRPYPSVSQQPWQKVGKARVAYTPMSSLKPSGFATLLRDVDADVLYLNSFFHPRVGCLPLAMWRLQLIPRLPRIVAPRGGFSPAAMDIKRWKKQPYLSILRRLAAVESILWHATSELERDDILRNIGRNAQVFVAPNLCLEHVCPAARRLKRSGHLRLVFLSRITPKKNLHGAINSIRCLAGRVELDVYGPIEDAAYWRRCLAQASRLPRRIRVNYQGTIAPERVASTLSSYDALLLPTLGENFGHAIFESLVAGCPVVISDRTPWRDLQTAGVGWDLPLESPVAIQSALDVLLKMDERAHRIMRDNARAFAERWQSGQKALDRSRQLFETARSLHSAPPMNSPRRAA